jgi:hypothetical protein
MTAVQESFYFFLKRKNNLFFKSKGSDPLISASKRVMAIDKEKRNAATPLPFQQIKVHVYYCYMKIEEHKYSAYQVDLGILRAGLGSGQALLSPAKISQAWARPGSARSPEKWLFSLLKIIKYLLSGLYIYSTTLYLFFLKYLKKHVPLGFSWALGQAVGGKVRPEPGPDVRLRAGLLGLGHPCPGLIPSLSILLYLLDFLVQLLYRIVPVCS